MLLHVLWCLGVVTSILESVTESALNSDDSFREVFDDMKKMMTEMVRRYLMKERKTVLTMNIFVVFIYSLKLAPNVINPWLTNTLPTLQTIPLTSYPNWISITICCKARIINCTGQTGALPQHLSHSSGIFPYCGIGQSYGNWIFQPFYSGWRRRVIKWVSFFCFSSCCRFCTLNADWFATPLLTVHHMLGQWTRLSGDERFGT